MKILSWNIRSIYGKIDGVSANKLKDVQVENMLKQYDLIFLQETHLEGKTVEDITLMGYTSLHYCRPKRNKASSASGGISVFVKEKYRQQIKFLPQNNPDIVWLQIIDRKTKKINDDLYVGCVYIPPEFSSFGKEHTLNIWDKLESDIESLSHKGNIVICGDFNARTGTLTDFIQIDSQQKPYDLPHDYLYDNVHQRCSMDKLIQKNGRRIIDICIDNNLHILNGRTLGDLQGKFTCFHPQGCSVVDYFWCSQYILKDIYHMKVNNLTEYSDHCPVEIEIYIPMIEDHQNMESNFKGRFIGKNNSNIIQKNISNTFQSFKWDENSSNQFKQTMKLPQVQLQIANLKLGASKLLETLEQNTQQINKLHVQKAVEMYVQQVSSIFIETAKLSLKRKIGKS